MGMDSGWFGRFMDAYFDSLSATDLAIWKVVRRDMDSGSRTALTSELSWQAAWDAVERLRKDDPEHRYDCEHDIRY